jgi:hypothetical protein
MNRPTGKNPFTRRPSFRVALAAALAACGTLASVAFVMMGPAPARAQETRPPESKPAEGSGSAETPANGLDETEASLERRYQQFERTLLQMAEYLRKTEPERADLLIRAIGRSKETRISQQMEAITQLLKKEQFGDAIGDQQHLVTDLKGLLELLQSEDRRHQLEQEKQYYELLHKEVNKLSAREKDLRRATERGGNLNRLGQRQGDIGKDAQSLLDKIEKEDASRNGPDGKPNASRNSKNGQKGNKGANGDKKAEGDQNSDKKSDAEKSDSKKEDGDKKSGADKKSDTDKKNDTGKKSGDKQAKGDQQPGSKDGGQKDEKKDGKDGDKQSSPDSQPKNDSKKGDSKKGDSKKGKSDQKQGKGQPPQPGEQGEESEPQEGSPSEGEQPQETQPKKTPGRNEIEAARRAMRQAEEELKRLEGKKGMGHQDEAIRKLAEARAQLEKILRQLRQEEQQIVLRSLEARFAKMLVMQLQIHVDTVALSKTPSNAWTVKHFGRARELSVDEATIADEAAKALKLLKEEGSSVAFPQGVEQVRDDMLTISTRLSGNDVAAFTQSIERDVIESLEEMVTALQNEIEKREKQDENRRQQKGQRGQGEEEKQLVQELAELKMLRSLQFRVNRRTREIGLLVKGEQASNEKLLQDLSKLAHRQAEIQDATYIIATGRNR